ncbi:cysteine--1-D-myo-inosityl 2-amino-2-deoxy-alpha-D-glucopyranoside ligase [Glaciihabitans sp. UYNi722]|uniref:cysteine--1-D-myo-inosityl 2-amino-2-deoxy-alpha-D-glucopyranoside ligase n=1 Tax=Glaciihabitans sp. UYNi722 TaxID=3156344 RepID=UPI003397036E
MKTWTRPTVPRLPGFGPIPRIFDSATRRLVETSTEDVASIYVCGITPYDATHLGHAATYLAYDTLIRLWLDAGLSVDYVQNSTDVDDPLLERAARDGVDWRDLAAAQTELFRGDMEQLRIIPPDHYVAVTEVIGEVADAVKILEDAGLAYAVDSPDAAPDLYFDSSFTAPAWHLGAESNLDRATMLELSAERGGDPQRSGKRDPLDPLLWRSERSDDPAWDSVLGRGRPGWHVECSVIAMKYLRSPITVNGGGSDLIFPHHEFSAGHATALNGQALAGIYSHAGMVAYHGEKMSKSLGNLVLVSRLAAADIDPRVIRLALLSEHYRSDWEWTDAHLDIARKRLERWTTWAATMADETDAFLAELRLVLSDDLDSPAALTAIDSHIAAGGSASVVLVDAIDALLGVQLL